MALVLDAGALIAIERRDRTTIARLVRAHENAEPVVTSAAVVAQVIRNRGRQVTLERVLAGIEEEPLDSDAARRVGHLLHANNYAGAVKRLNLIQQQLGTLPPDAAPYQVGSLKREELIASNSMTLHEHYFGNLGGSGRADGAAAGLLKTEYGSLETWAQDFRQTALSLGGGSGWVVVAYHRSRQALHNWWAWDHAHQVSGGEPVLVLDLYEHAYHIDYGAAVKPYIDAFLANVQWDEVNRRVEKARGTRSGPST